jgi:hypothetical protein
MYTTLFFCIVSFVTANELGVVSGPFSVNNAQGSPSLPHYKVLSFPHTTVPYSSEWIPDFAAQSVVTISASSSGSWNSASTWNLNRVPSSSDIVLIGPEFTVTGGGDMKAAVLGIKGKFQTASNADAKLTVTTILVYPGGALTVEPSANVNHEVVFKGEVNVLQDPSQLGVGLVAFGGTVRIVGGRTLSSWAFLEGTSPGTVQKTFGKAF